jgi:hypothetical protein
MKTFLMAIIAIASSSATHSQSQSFTGRWSGTITTTEKGTARPFEIQIDSNKVTTFTINEQSGKELESVEHNYFFQDAKLIFSWINNSTYIGERQVYTLRVQGKDTISVEWTRKCTVYTIRKKATDDVWSEHGSGFLTRSASTPFASMQ